MARLKISQFKHILFSKKFIALLLIIIVSVLCLFFYFKTKKINNPALLNKNLPYKEKIGEGIWELKNYDPIKQSFATEKTNTNLVENKNAIESSIANPFDIEIYRWSVTLPNKTVFAFGQQTKEEIFPAVKVTNKNGLFVKYYPEGFSGFVKPEVKGNVIEWEIKKGIKARYTMMQDRVKADYIVNTKEDIINGKLDFTVDYSTNKEKSLMPEMMPKGDIAWFDRQNKEIFNFPVPQIKENSQNQDSEEKVWNGSYKIIKQTPAKLILSIVLPADKLEKAKFPLIVDPQVVDITAASTSTAYGNGRKILRDGWGNLIILFDGGTGNDNVYYKNYNSVTWQDANIDIDGGGGSSVEISADLDSTGSAHLAFRNTTANAIQYKSLKINRLASNVITSITTHASFSLDTSTFGARPSVIVANKGGGVGVEKIAIAYGMNSTGAGRGEIRFMQCDVADDCTTATNWKNASEEINGSSTCSDTATSGAAGLPNSATCKGTADKLFNVATNTTHHAVLTQIPGKSKRSPASVKKDINSTFTTLSNTIDNNTGTTNDVNSLTTTDYIYVGDDKPFSKATFDLTNINDCPGGPPNCGFGTYQYWNGASWISLSNFIDITKYGASLSNVSFREDGSLVFDEPSDWATTTVDGVSGKYWVRFRPSGAFDSTVSIAEVYVNDRNSKALLVAGGVDSTDDLGASYVVWDEINNDRWENTPDQNGTSVTPDIGMPWRVGITALDTLGGNWTTFTNFPLTATVDYKNNSIFVSYVEDLATDVLHVKKIENNLDLTVAANWTDTSFPTVTEGTDIVLSLTADGSDIYLFYVLDPGTNSLVFRKCTPSGGGDGNKCDNSADWGSEKILVSGTDLSHPQAVVTKITGDTVAIDTIYTMPTALDVYYERHYADLSDKTVTVAASGDDAYQVECYTLDPSQDSQDITSTTVEVGSRFAGVSLCGGGTDPDRRHAGFRFSNITVAQGSVISSAYVDFKLVSTNSGINFTLYGEDSDNASAFLAKSGCDANCITQRTRTTGSSSQSMPDQSTSIRIDVTDIIQEIICRGAANTQPCVGNFNGSGSWSSGNSIAILLISTGSTGNSFTINTFDDTGNSLEPTLQINLAPSGTANKNYSLGSSNELATGSASFADLDHSFSSAEFSSVSSDDTNYASVSATTNYASQSAVPAFMFKVNNSNNDNTYKINAQAIVKSTVPTSSKPVYLQVYRGGSTNNWVTMASNNNTASDTDVTLTSPQITSSLSEYYFNETPGIGTRYAECTNATANCWSYWRLYQDSVGTDQNAVLSLDYIDISFTIQALEVSSAKLKGGVNIKGGSKLK